MKILKLLEKERHYEGAEEYKNINKYVDDSWRARKFRNISSFQRRYIEKPGSCVLIKQLLATNRYCNSFLSLFARSDKFTFHCISTATVSAACNFNYIIYIN
jgi:hypothetical protein